MCRAVRRETVSAVSLARFPEIIKVSLI